MMMKLIHEFMMLDPAFTLRQMGTQEYEADVVELEKKGRRIFPWLTWSGVCSFKAIEISRT